MYHHRSRVMILVCTMLAVGTVVSRGADITGAGTANYIPKFTGTAVIGDSAIYQSSGLIGIGTTSPSAPLHVSGDYGVVRVDSSSVPFILRDTGQTLPVGLWRVVTNGGQFRIDRNTAAGGDFATYAASFVVMEDGEVRMLDGPVGIGGQSTGHQLSVSAEATGTYATDPGNAQLSLSGLYDNTTRLALGVDTTSGKARIQAADYGVGPIDLLLQPAGGNVGIGTTSPAERLTVRGNVLIEHSDCTDVLELGDGLDYAEGFDIAGSERPEPGTVLVIDLANPGQLTVSGKSYDTTVAGIVAGAHSLGSGVRLGVNQFDCDVALAGRVYCNVDATECAVQPGDLLTTSATPGYAMKATDRTQTASAVLGKAMQGLEKGQKGQILVLVTLQ